MRIKGGEGHRNTTGGAIPLHRFLMPTRRKCHDLHEMESEAPFNLGASWSHGNLRMDSVAAAGVLTSKILYRATCYVRRHHNE